MLDLFCVLKSHEKICFNLGIWTERDSWAARVRFVMRLLPSSNSWLCCIIYIYKHLSISIYLSIYRYIYIYISIYICIYTYICACVYAYIHILNKNVFKLYEQVCFNPGTRTERDSWAARVRFVRRLLPSSNSWPCCIPSSSSVYDLSTSIYDSYSQYTRCKPPYTRCKRPSISIYGRSCQYTRYTPPYTRCERP